MMSIIIDIASVQRQLGLQQAFFQTLVLGAQSA